MADKGFTPEQDKKAMRNEPTRLERENKHLKKKFECQDAMLDPQKKPFRSWILMLPIDENEGRS